MCGLFYIKKHKLGLFLAKYKIMKKILMMLAVFGELSACTSLAPFPEEDKTPLTPQGKLNACILEQARQKAVLPETFGDVDLAANQVANYCIRSLDMLDSGLYRQSVINATAIINSYNQ